MRVAKTRDSIPFGMNIRKAAYKAAFGTSGSHPILQKYATVARKTMLDPLDDLSSSEEENDSSDSVSIGSSIGDGILAQNDKMSLEQDKNVASAAEDFFMP